MTERRPNWSTLVRWALPLGLATSITLLSGRGVPAVGPPEIPHLDKLIHLLVFGLLATAIYRAFPGGMRDAYRLLWTIGLTVAFGASDELHQGMTPYRTMDGWDLLADAVGAVLATLVYRHWALYRRILEWPRRQTGVPGKTS